jgi:raffinose/stachyose/melibiose transport system permease protein
MKSCPFKKARLFIFFFLLPAFLIYTGFLLLPILNSMRLSLYEVEGMVPKSFVGLENYRRLFTQFPFKERLVNAFFNNIKFFLIVTFLQNFVGFFMAVTLTRKYRGNQFFRKISFLPTTLSVLVVGFLFNLILNPVWGVFDRILNAIGLGKLIVPWLGTSFTALPILAIVVSWQFMGESILFYTAGIDAIDKSILESARIDGVSLFSEIRYIILPSIWPIVGIVTILIFIGDFTQFDIVYAMTTTRGNPAYSTDLFGSLFYRSAFQIATRDGWGLGMGSTLATVMFIFLFIGVVLWLMVFKRKRPE